MLLSQDPDDELVIPDVLNCDVDKYNKTKDNKYVEKAIRRGKFGYKIGESLTVNPHWRKAHPHLYWTGEGRKIPRIKFVKGVIVHKEVVSKLPTGFIKEVNNE